jgi:hypothetical protein
LTLSSTKRALYSPFKSGELFIMETLQINKTIIVLTLEEEEKRYEKFLKQIAYRGFHNFSKEQYYEWVRTHPFYQDYDKTHKLREQHDRELSDWREERDRTLRVRLRITLNPNLTDA